MATKSRWLTVGGNVPQRGNWFGRTVARLVLRLFGWGFDGAVPDVPRAVVIGAPHTSNWDGPVAFFAMFALDIRVSVMIKHTLFRRPYKRALRWLGGFPVNRTAAHGAVGDVVRAFRQSDKMWLVLAPEGTRSNVKRWKSGFYFIAQKADVPILVAGPDFERKRVVFGPLIAPSGDYEADLARIQTWYQENTVGRRPELGYLGGMDDTA